MMHYAGIAGAGSEKEAGRWLEQALAGGHVLARYQLATMYAQVRVWVLGDVGCGWYSPARLYFFCFTNTC
jgi:TPR repeat protein